MARVMSSLVARRAGVAFAATEAGIGRRLAALLLDLGIAILAFVALNVLLYKLGVLSAPQVSQPSPLLEVWEQAEPWIALAVAMSVLVVLAWSMLSATPGALLMGVNIVRARDGRRAGIVRCAWRLLVSVCLLGFGFMGAWRGKRALHDRISGTRAVLEDESNRSIDFYAARMS